MYSERGTTSGSPASLSARPLSHSPVGSRAVLHGSRLSPEDHELLEAMGLVGNCTLQVLNQGNPCVVAIGDTRMGLARSLADNILVRDAG